MLKIGCAFSHSIQFQRCGRVTTFTRDVSSELDKAKAFTQTPWENVIHANLRSLMRNKTPFTAADRIGQIFNLLTENVITTTILFTIYEGE